MRFFTPAASNAPQSLTPAQVVSIYKGDACIDPPRPDRPACSSTPQPNDDCPFESCGFIRIAAQNFPPVASCFLDSEIGQVGQVVDTLPANGEVQTGFSFGQTGRRVWITCDVGPLYGGQAYAETTWP